jgi:hypothetical protein
MLQCEVLGDQAIVILTSDRSTEKTDFSAAATAVDQCIEKHGKITGLMIRAESYDNWSQFADLIEELRFIQRKGIPIERVAGLSDGNLEVHLPAIAERLESGEYRHFHFDERGKALEWLESGH